MSFSFKSVADVEMSDFSLAERPLMLDASDNTEGSASVPREQSREGNPRIVGETDDGDYSGGATRGILTTNLPQSSGISGKGILRHPLHHLATPGEHEAADAAGHNQVPAMEIRLEHMTSRQLRLLLALFTLVLVAAVPLTAYRMDIQWSCWNMCGGKCVDPALAGSSEACSAIVAGCPGNTTNTTTTTTTTTSNIISAPVRRTSSRANTSSSGRTGRHLRWWGYFPDTTNVLRRFYHVAFTVQPNISAPGLPGTVLSFELSATPPVDSDCTSQDHRSGRVFRTASPIKCNKDSCNSIVLPAHVIRRPDSKMWYLDIRSPPVDVIPTLQRATVAVLHQHESYTIGMFVVRYTLMTVTVGAIILFASRSIFLYEQRWVLVLLIGVAISLNPLIVLCVYRPGMDVGVYEASASQQLYDILTYEGEHIFDDLLRTFPLVLIFAARDGEPRPLGTALCVGHMLFLTALRIAFIAQHGWDWTITPPLNPVGVENFTNVIPAVSCGFFILYAVFVVFSMSSMKKRFARLPYLETRARQLGFRVFSTVFMLHVISFVFSFLVSLLRRPSTVEILLYHSSSWLTVVVLRWATVHVIAYMYSTARHDTKFAPPHPLDPRWKALRWPLEWCQWLTHRGGNSYYFDTVEEQVKFTKLQFAGGDGRAAGDGAVTDTSPHTLAGFLASAVDATEAALFNVVDRLEAATTQHDTAHELQEMRGRANTARYRDQMGSSLTSAGSSWELMDGVLSGGDFFCLETCVHALSLSYEVYAESVPADFRDLDELSGSYRSPRSLKQSYGDATRTEGGADKGDDIYYDISDSDDDIMGNAGGGEGLLVGNASVLDRMALSFAPKSFALVDDAMISEAMRHYGKELDVAKYGYQLCWTAQFHSIRAMIVVDNITGKEGCPRRVVVVFRGTANATNVKTDARMSRRAWDEMANKAETQQHSTKTKKRPLVHKGFIAAWEKPDPSSGLVMRDVVLNQLAAAVADVGGLSKGSSLLISGHSLGGAMATLCAYTVANRNGWIPQVYVFGSPRVGNRVFAQRYNALCPSVFRVVNEGDVVSRYSWLGMKHVGTEVMVSAGGRLVCRPMFIERFFRPYSQRNAFLSHLLDNYAHSINCIVDSSSCPVGALEAIDPPSMS